MLSEETVCWYCGQEVRKDLPPQLPDSPEVHELIPVAQGGSPFERDNCRLTHRRCNQAIGNRTPEQLTAAALPPSPIRTSIKW